MRNFLIVLTGFLVGGGVVVGIALALPRMTTVTITQSPAVSAMPMSGATGSGMMAAPAAPATRQLTIQHVLRGCHVWSNGTTTAATMRLNLKLGQRLSIVDQDVDAHQMLELAGPAHMRMGGPMTMNRSITLSFPRKGVYRLGTKTVEMPGAMSMNVKTIGPDNSLRLLVTVA